MKRELKLIFLFLQGISSFITVPKVCEFSKLWFDIHDYPSNKGGDNTPSHFYTYQCWSCGKKFEI